MNCIWGYTWHGYYFYHSWLFWLILSAGLSAATLFYLFFQKRRQKKCPNCSTPVESAFLQCPECGHGLQTHCPDCYRIVDRLWKTCPYCEKSLQFKI